MNGSNGRSPRDVGAVVDQVPEHVGRLRDSSGEASSAAASGGKVEPQQLGGRAAHAPEPLGLAVAEDRPEVVPTGRSAVGEGLGEQHGALGVVAGRAIDEGDRDELRVVVAGAPRARPTTAARARGRPAPRSSLSRDPFCLYIGNTTRCSMPSRRSQLGAERVERAVEVGHAEAAVGPGSAGRRRPRRGSRSGAGSAASARPRDSAIDPSTRARGRVGRAPRCRPQPSGSWAQAQRLDLVAAARASAGSAGDRRSASGPRRARRRRLGGPVDQVEPQVCGDPRSAMQSSPNRSESASTATRPAPATPPAASGAFAASRRSAGSGRDPRAVGAPARRPGRSRRRRRGRARSAPGRPAPGVPSVGQHPGRRVARGGARSPERSSLAIAMPKRADQVAEVGAVLVLLGLAEEDQAAARADPRLDRVELLGGEQRRAAGTVALPARVGRMGDHQHVGVGEEPRRQRPVGVRGDLEVALGERVGGARRSDESAGCAGWIGGGDVGPDRPRLGVGLVEEDAGGLRRSSVHNSRLAAAPIRRQCRCRCL